MDIAQQDILFRLNRSGAELKSEMRMYTLGGPTYYLFDRPFLVCLRKREAEHPYFVMWVDNAELLQRFQGGLAFPSKTFSFWHGFKRHSRG